MPFSIPQSLFSSAPPPDSCPRAPAGRCPPPPLGQHQRRAPPPPVLSPSASGREALPPAPPRAADPPPAEARSSSTGPPLVLRWSSAVRVPFPLLVRSSPSFGRRAPCPPRTPAHIDKSARSLSPTETPTQRRRWLAAASSTWSGTSPSTALTTAIRSTCSSTRSSSGPSSSRSSCSSTSPLHSCTPPRSAPRSTGPSTSPSTAARAPSPPSSASSAGPPAAPSQPPSASPRMEGGVGSSAVLLDYAVHRAWSVRGVVVKPGEQLKCDPGELHYHISQITLEASKAKENVGVFVNIDGKRIMLGTLSVDKYPQIATDLVFNKEFELLHSSKTSNISFTGYQFKTMKISNSSTKEGDKSDEDCPLAIPLVSNVDDVNNKEATHGANKVIVPRPADVPSSKPKATVEETNSAGKPKAEDNDSEGSGSGDDKLQSAKGENRPVETPLKTPPGKKAKIATPTMGYKTGSAAAKRSGHVHVATPHPAKQARKTPANNDKSKLSTGYMGNSCNRTFYSSMGLEAHSKVKHSATK